MREREKKKCPLPRAFIAKKEKKKLFLLFILIVIFTTMVALSHSKGSLGFEASSGGR